MAGYGGNQGYGQGYGQGMDQQGFYQYNYDDQQQGYDMGSQQVEGAQSSYDYNYPQGYAQPSVYDQGYGGAQSPYTGDIMTPEPMSPGSGGYSDNFEDEEPLLQELGINFEHIYQKTLAVLNPLRETDPAAIADCDLAGPLVFALAFGGSLMLAGKVQFGYIYGIGGLGCLAMWMLLNVMSMTGCSASGIVSVLGYCLLPMVLLNFLAIVVSLKGIFGTIASLLTIGWCSWSASKLFVTALAMDQQQLLVAYPCALLYGVFALLTVF